MFVFSHFFQPIHCFSRFHRLFDFCDAVMFSANIDLTQHKCHIVRPSRTVKHFQELSASLEEPFSRISSSCIPKYRWTLLNIGSYSGRQQFRGQSYIVKKVSGRTRYTVVHLSTWHQWKRNEVFKCTIRLHSNSKELAPSRDCWVLLLLLQVGPAWNQRIGSPGHLPLPTRFTSTDPKRVPQRRRLIRPSPSIRNVRGALGPSIPMQMAWCSCLIPSPMYKTPPNLAYTILYLHILRWCGPRWAWTHCKGKFL
jgi:hypothetical protein